MNSVVVYESLWGNTAAIAHAIAEGLGENARALTTDEATAEIVTAADVVVAGAPVIGFNLASDKVREGLGRSERASATPPDTFHPSLRSWLEALPACAGVAAAFETRIWWSPRGATGAIEKGLRKAGYRVFAKPSRFVVDGKYGPLREGELERAREWGRELAASAKGAVVQAA